MKSDKLETLREHLTLIIIIIVVLTPSIWGLTSLHYRERIDVLKEKEGLLGQQIQFLESKLKAPPQFPIESSPTSTLTATTKQRPISPSGELKVRYPRIADSSKLSRSQVKDLATFYKLFNDWKVNPHLRFKDGDVSYWYEQSLPEEALKREFDSRRIILERSEATGEVINTPGDLSHKAEGLQAQMRSR